LQTQEFWGEITINWPLLFGCGTQLYNGREGDTTSTSVHLEPKNDWCECTCHSQALSTKPDICKSQSIERYYLAVELNYIMAEQGTQHLL
jgi:hypothetical protein